MGAVTVARCSRTFTANCPSIMYDMFTLATLGDNGLHIFPTLI